MMIEFMRSAPPACPTLAPYRVPMMPGLSSWHMDPEAGRLSQIKYDVVVIERSESGSEIFCIKASFSFVC